MFNDYLVNSITYDKLERHLTEMFEGELKKNNLKREDFKYPHYNNYCTDGTRLMEGDSIFSAKAIATGNILRVAIYEEISDYSIIHNSAGDNDELDELLLAIRISDVERVRQSMSDWIKLQ